MGLLENKKNIDVKFGGIKKNALLCGVRKTIV